MRIKIVAFSGIDGCGKSTQIELLSKYYEGRDEKHRVIWVRPGSTPFILALKALARLLFRSLPKGGRSDQREKLLKKSKVGKLWFYLTFFELIYIFKIRVPVIVFFGNRVIYDRHIFDSIIDYKVMINRSLFGIRLVDILLKSSDATLKIFLDIPIETSIERCNQKWEPFPDTSEEKILRYKTYQDHLDDYGYVIFDGLKPPNLIHQSILQLIK